MRLARFAFVLILAGSSLIGTAGEALFGENLVEVKLTLPKGEAYFRGATDPVADLVAELTLTNKTKKENLAKETVNISTATRITPDEIAKLEKQTPDEHAKLVASKKEDKTIEVFSPNKESLGYAFVEPRLGPYDFVEFIITKLPDEGEAPVEGAKPVIIPRDNKPDQVNRVDLAPTHYLAAGESSPVFSLPVGKYYLVRDPGLYSIKAVLKLIPDSAQPGRFCESNEEKFRILPLKVMEHKIEQIQANWADYERGVPTFDYLVYQVKTSGPFDEVWAVQRMRVRHQDKWEWTRLCTVKQGTTIQLAPLGGKKVAILSQHAKGDVGLYTLDFTKPGVVITAKISELKAGSEPKLKVEGGQISVE